MKSNNWETVLRNKDRDKAIELVERIGKTRKQYGESFDKFAEIVGYPKDNVWIGGVLNSHFRRVLVELRILAIYGKVLLKV